MSHQYHSIIILLFFFNLFYQYQASDEAFVIPNTTFIDPVIIAKDGEGACPSQERRDAVKNRLLMLQTLQYPTSSMRGASTGMLMNVDQACFIKWPVSTRVTLHSSVHLPGESTTLVESGLVEDQLLQVVVVQLLLMTSRQYSRVCGKAIRHQIGSTVAFGWAKVPQINSS